MESFNSVTTSNHRLNLLVPTRNVNWYTKLGYEPLSAGIFYSSARGADLVIDIGAYVGFYSLLASKANPKIPVIAIEASSDNFKILQHNITNAGADNVNALHGIFGKDDEVKPFQITEASDNCGLSGHVNSPTIRIENVNGISGDTLQIPDGLKVLIKIDVEGHEFEVLESIGDIIKGSTSPRILVEINPKMISHAGYKLSSILKLLHSFGLRLFLVDDSNSTWREISPKTKFLEDEIAEGYRNLYCVKKSSISLLSFLHSGRYGGAEKSHLEFASDHIANGGMIATHINDDIRSIETNLISRGSGCIQSQIPRMWWISTMQIEEEEQLNKNYFENGLVEELASNLRKNRFDLVLSQTSVSTIGAQVAKSLKLPHIWWIREFGDLDHHFFYPFPINELGDVFLKYSDLVLTNSECVLKHFYPNGHERVFISKPFPRTFTEIAPPSGTNSKTLAIIGNINPGKGHETILRALQICNSSSVNVNLKIIGKDHSNYAETLKALALELGIYPQVSFEGYFADVTKIYTNLSGVIVASYFEAFGRIPFEATTFGLPVLYAKSGGMMEYMKDGHNGLGFEPGDHIGLAHQIKRVIGDKNFADRLVLNAQAELLNSQRAEADSVELYKKLLKLKKRAWWSPLIR